MLRLSSNTKSSLHTAPAKLVDYNKYIAPRKSHLLPRAPPTVGSAPINGGMGRRPRLGQTPVSECKMSVIDFFKPALFSTPSHTHMPYKIQNVYLCICISPVINLRHSKRSLALLVASRDPHPLQTK